MSSEFLILDKVDNKDYISDYWIFDDEYIKEIKYFDDGPKVCIYEIDDFIKDNPNHQLVKKIGEYKAKI